MKTQTMTTAKQVLTCVSALVVLFAAAPLAADTAQARRAAVLESAEAGCGNVGAVEAALADDAATVRRTAISALARLDCATAYEAVKHALAHEDAEVRRLAMQGLGRDWIMRHHLAEALSDPDSVVRNWASHHVGEHQLAYEHGFELNVTLRFDALPDPDRNALVVRKWESADDERSFLLFYRAPHLRFSVTGDGRNADTVRSHAIDTDVTYQVTAVFDPDGGELRLTLADDDRETTWTQPTELDRPYPSNHPIVIGGSSFEGEVSRVSVAPAHAQRHITGDHARQRREAVLRHADRGPFDVAVLEAALADPAALVRRTAAHALGRVGSPLAHEALQQCLTHDDAAVRRLAMQGLGPHWLLRYHLTEALADDDPVVRNWVRVHLGAHAPEDEALWARVGEQLERAFEHSAALVRYQAVKLCSHWDEAPERFGEMLDALAADDTALVREAAQRVMWPFEATLQSSRQRFAGVPLALADEIPLPRDGWRFRTEQAGRAGHLLQWYSPDYDDADWDRVPIEAFWGQVGYEGYVGVGWYRRTFEAPSGEYDAAELHFGAADESAWVWLNGEYVSQHDIGAAGWDTPFTMDVTDLIQPGEANHITVRVRNTMAAGGIHKPIVLRLYEKR